MRVIFLLIATLTLVACSRKTVCAMDRTGYDAVELCAKTASCKISVRDLKWKLRYEENCIN